MATLPACEHEVREWAYEWEATYPRAYGVCEVCGDVVVSLLPRQAGSWFANSWQADKGLLEAGRRVAVQAASAAESHLRSPGVPQRLRSGLLGEAVELRSAVLRRAVQLGLEAGERVLGEAEERAASLEMAIDRAEQDLAALDARTEKAKRRLRAIERRAAPALTARAPDVLCVGGESVSWVYALVASSDLEHFRYIGSTNAPGTRLLSHTGQGAAPAVRRWAREVEARGHHVVMRGLWQGMGRDEAYRVEQDMIARYVALGMADLNTSLPAGHARTRRTA